MLRVDGGPPPPAQVISVTGALGSGVLCYILPAVNHLVLYSGYAKCLAARGDGGAAPEAAPGGEHPHEAPLLLQHHESVGVHGPPERFVYPSFAEDGLTVKSVVIHMILPGLLIVLGVVTSLAVFADFNLV